MNVKTIRKYAIVGGLSLSLLTGTTHAIAADSNAVISIGSLYEPQNLDNTGGGGQGVTEALNGNVYEGLFKLTDTGKVENLLATSSKISADGLTYTIGLRPNVHFHSGKTVTSADVKYSITKVTSADSQSAR